MNIYVIYTLAGNEQKIARECRSKILLTGEDVYVPLYNREKKKQGEIRVVQSALFPGYIFFETDDIESLKRRVKTIKDAPKLVGQGDEIYPLYEDEARLIYKLCGKAHILDISKGVMEGQRVRVIQGPLLGMDALIVSVNRHKRTAVIEIEVLRRKIRVTVGLETI